jgi:hypothetical protein
MAARTIERWIKREKEREGKDGLVGTRSAHCFNQSVTVPFAQDVYPVSDLFPSRG